VTRPDQGVPLRRERRRYNVAHQGAHATPVYVYRRHRPGRLTGALVAWCRALVRALGRAHQALAPRDGG
jgi:hypothetical protein